MSVRRKLYLLLGITVLIFATALFWIWAVDHKQYAAMDRERMNERKESFERFLQSWGGSLETFVNDYSRSDEMVNAIKKGDRSWAESNLNSGASANNRAHVMWIYRPDKTLFYSRNNLYSNGLDEVPIARGGFEQLFASQKLVHFFAKTAAGVVEIRGATVHPSRDIERSGPAEGFFFAGRLWSPEELKEMSRSSGNQLSLVDAGYTGAGLVLPHGAIAFTRPLPGWDGKPAARVMVRHDSPLIEQVAVLRWRLWAWILLFTGILVSVVAFALRRWVWRPLYRVSQSVRREDPALVARFDNDRSEIGDLARMIRSFFEQREALLREIRDRRQAEKALYESEEHLRQSQKMEAVARLAGGVSHDFNNLLTAIIGYAGMLRDRLKEDEESREDLEQIMKAGDRAAALTRHLLAFSRKQVLHPRVIDLNVLVTDMDPLLRRVIGEHIEFRISATASQSFVRADRAQIEQVLLNLVANARDAMPRGGILTVSTADTLIPEPIQQNGMNLPAGRYVTLSVTDTGCGIDDLTRERMFEPFFTTKPASEGTGLGLATVYGVVQQSGGAISLTSTSGKGTTFLVHLPLVAEGATEVETPSFTSGVFDREPHGKMVLVIESDPSVRNLVNSVLRAEGYQVICAETPQAARILENQNRGNIRLLLTDVVNHETSGPEMAEEFRATNPEMEVLFMSGYTESPGMDHFLVEIGTEVLEKPFTPPVLVERVREILSRPSPSVALPR